jgi:hypothetical protein
MVIQTWSLMKVFGYKMSFELVNRIIKMPFNMVNPLTAN